MLFEEEKIAKIIQKIASNCMFKLDGVKVLPRGNDLPHHYIKINDDIEGYDEKRIDIILSLETLFARANKEEKYVSTKRKHNALRFLIVFPYSKAFIVIDKSGDGKLYLTTAYKGKNYKVNKVLSNKSSYTIFISNADLAHYIFNQI